MIGTQQPTLIIRNLSNSNLFAQFSEQLAIASLPILAVLELGANAAQTASLQAMNTLPFLILSIPAGVLADRSRRKVLMSVAELIRAIALFMVFFLFFSHSLNLSILAILGFVIATGTVVYSVTAPALVATLIEKEHLLPANRRLEIARSIAFTAGPAIGGVMADWASGMFGFLLAFILSIISVLWLSKLPTEPTRIITQRNILKELCEGIQFVVKNTYLRPIAATAFIFNTSWYLLLSVFTYYVVHHLAFTGTYVGLAYSIFGFGMLVGAFAYQQITRYIRFGHQIIIGPICACVAATLMALTLVWPSTTLVMIAFFLFGIGPIIWTISTTSLRQIVTPTEMIARVSSFIMTISFGARPLGAVIGAWLAAQYDVQSCLIAVVIGFFLQLILILFSAPSRLDSIDQLKPGTV